MNIIPLLIVSVHLILLPLIFNLLRYVRLEELFKRQTSAYVVTVVYFVLTIALTQLIIGYFVNVFTFLSEVF